MKSEVYAPGALTADARLVLSLCLYVSILRRSARPRILEVAKGVRATFELELFEVPVCDEKPSRRTLE